MTETCKTCRWFRPAVGMVKDDRALHQLQGICVVEPPTREYGGRCWPPVWPEHDYCGRHDPSNDGNGDAARARRLKVIRTRILEAEIDHAIKRSDLFTARGLADELAKLVWGTDASQ